MDSRSCVSLSSLLPKASIDPSLYGHVDLALKRLKLVFRRLSATFTVLEEEYRVLNRLYYKGKNQHRTSLFWRRVEEMRRFCLRISSLDLLGILNRLRHSFYDSANYNNQNALKGAWTHVPQIGDMRTAIRNFTPVRQLLLKACERLTGAYCLFKRAMQTGAFLQLILTLSAIACRLQFLTQAILKIQEDISVALTELCISLELPPFLSVPADQPTLAILQQPPLSTPPEETPASGSKSVLEIGRKMTKPVNKSEKRQEPELKPKLQNIGSGAAAEQASLKPDKHTDLPATQRPKQKKKKKLVDDIDKIFGF